MLRTILFYLVIPVLICCTLPFLAMVAVYRIRVSEVAKYNDSAHYIVDFSTILGSAWQYFPLDYTDANDWDWSSAGASEGVVNNINNRSVFINQVVIAYFDAASSVSAYEDKSSIFSYYVSPGWHWDYMYIDKLSADRSKFACEVPNSSNKSPKNIECIGLLAYGRYIVEIHIYPVRDFQRYLSDEQIFSIIHLIDEQFQ